MREPLVYDMRSGMLNTGAANSLDCHCHPPPGFVYDAAANGDIPIVRMPHKFYEFAYNLLFALIVS